VNEEAMLPLEGQVTQSPAEMVAVRSRPNIERMNWSILGSFFVAFMCILYQIDRGLSRQFFRKYQGQGGECLQPEKRIGQYRGRYPQ